MMQIEDLYQLFVESTGTSTDTRSIVAGNIFFALKGPSFDGNKYSSQALDQGASFAIVDDPSACVDDRHILVDDVLTSLQDLACFHRKQFDIPVIGLTGSNGKTTTKELMSAVLGTEKNVLATKGNLNNHIGVPITLLGITQTTEVAIVEMGANHLGEISELCNIALPTHGLITNIGKAHIGMFGSFENIVRAKSELFDFLINHDGVIWVNSKDDILLNMSKRMQNPLFYPTANDDEYIEFEAGDPYLSYSDESKTITRTKLIGKYNFLNIAAALSVGRYFNIDRNNANTAIANYVPENNRSQVIKKENNTIILDAYNANPSSMTEALDNLLEMRTDNSSKVAILGDMYELGSSEIDEHVRIGEIISNTEIRALYVGKLMKEATKKDLNGISFETKEELKNYLKVNPIKNSVVLIKGSRGIKLEDVLSWI